MSILVSVWALMGGRDGDNGMIPIRVMGVPSDSDLVVMVSETECLYLYSFPLLHN